MIWLSHEETEEARLARSIISSSVRVTRVVRHFYQLMDKINVFDYGFDDFEMELFKFGFCVREGLDLATPFYFTGTAGFFRKKLQFIIERGSEPEIVELGLSDYKNAIGQLGPKVRRHVSEDALRCAQLDRSFILRIMERSGLLTPAQPSSLDPSSSPSPGKAKARSGTGTDIAPLAKGILPELDAAEFDERIVQGFEAMRAGKLSMVPVLDPEEFDEQIVKGFEAIRARRPENIPLLGLDKYDAAIAHGFATMKAVLSVGDRDGVPQPSEPDELELGEGLAVEVALVARYREADGIPVSTIVNEMAKYVQGVCGAWGVKLDAKQSREVLIAAQALYMDQAFMDEVAEWKRLNNDGVVPRSLFRTKLLAAVKRSVDGFMAGR
jgi:hypothetical protein